MADLFSDDSVEFLPDKTLSFYDQDCQKDALQNLPRLLQDPIPETSRLESSAISNGHIDHEIIHGEDLCEVWNVMVNPVTYQSVVKTEPKMDVEDIQHLIEEDIPVAAAEETLVMTNTKKALNHTTSECMRHKLQEVNNAPTPSVNTTLTPELQDTILLSDHQDTILLSDHQDTILLSDHQDTILLSDHQDTILPTEHHATTEFNRIMIKEEPVCMDSPKLKENGRLNTPDVASEMLTEKGANNHKRKKKANSKQPKKQSRYQLPTEFDDQPSTSSQAVNCSEERNLIEIVKTEHCINLRQRPSRQCKVEQSSRVGEMVFAKLNERREGKWWPAIVVDHNDCGMAVTHQKPYCVYWFGESKVSVVPSRLIRPFSEFVVLVKNDRNAKYQEAILQSLEAAAEKADFAVLKDENLIEWALGGFRNPPLSSSNSVFQGKPVPESIISRLKEIKKLKEPVTRKSVHDVKSTNMSINKMFSRREFIKRYSTVFGRTFLHDLLASVEEQSKYKDGPYSSLREKNNTTADQTEPQAPRKPEAKAKRKNHTKLSSHELPVGKDVGKIVWAKFASRWWPAMVIDSSDCGKKEAGISKTWVYWLGDHKVSLVYENNTIEFTSNFSSHFSQKTNLLYSRAITETLQIVADRLKYRPSQVTPEPLLIWAKNGFKPQIDKKSAPTSNTIPSPVRAHLKRIKSMTPSTENSSSDSDSTTSDSSDDSSEEEDETDLSFGASQRVKDSVRGITDICIACNSYKKEIVSQHPLFKGGLCESCTENFCRTIFVSGNDGKNVYCTICNSLGRLYMCDSDDCPRTFCKRCIKRWSVPGAIEELNDIDPWYCFCCTEYKHHLNGDLVAKEDSVDNIRMLFLRKWRLLNDPRKPLRVLSLFDGIGTVKCIPK